MRWPRRLIHAYRSDETAPLRSMPGGVLTDSPAQPLALLLGNFGELQEKIPFGLRKNAPGRFEIIS